LRRGFILPPGDTAEVHIGKKQKTGADTQGALQLIAKNAQKGINTRNDEPEYRENQNHANSARDTDKAGLLLCFAFYCFFRG